MTWQEVKSTHPTVVELFSRHYSAKKNGIKPDAWRRSGIAGPGQTLTLLLETGDALFGWIYNTIARYDKQEGVNCYVFRNESEYLSSDLVVTAVDLARVKWGNKRLFTYVDPAQIGSANPGYCFKKAGWSYCGKSKRGLHILEITGQEEGDEKYNFC